MNRAVFLDRDGTINVEKNYLFQIDDWEWIEGAVKAIKMINEMGFLVVVVTNQAGIAKGYYKESDVNHLHKFVDKLLFAEQAKIDAYYMCPHNPDGYGNPVCGCRKPFPGMIYKAKQDFNLDLMNSFLIGDKLSDVEAGKSAGLSTYLVSTGYGEFEKKRTNASFFNYSENILDAVNHIQGLAL